MNISINKNYIKYDKLSRYSDIPIYFNIIDKRYFGGTVNHLSNKTLFIEHEIKNTDTLDSLALYYYGNPTYYWIIADFNRIRDPFIQLIEGEKIKIPTFSDIEFE